MIFASLAKTALIFSAFSVSSIVPTLLTQLTPGYSTKLAWTGWALVARGALVDWITADMVTTRRPEIIEKVGYCKVVTVR